MVAKPVIVKHDGGFTMCVLPAPKHLDLKRVAEALQKDDVSLASEEEMAELFDDCELGAEPPVGPLFEMPTVMDQLLKDDEHLLIQAGSHTESIKIRREDWEKICRPIVASVAAN
jgi:Ala-tRNA(Pro) deacylase